MQPDLQALMQAVATIRAHMDILTDAMFDMEAVGPHADYLSKGDCAQSITNTVDAISHVVDDSFRSSNSASTR